jgi:hypothetical protein
MTNRLILGAHAGTYVLRASRPGYNVLDDGIAPAGVGFDSRRTSALKVRLQGIVAWSGGTPSTASISFGMTFPSPPIIFLASREGNVLRQLELIFNSTGGYSQAAIGDVTTTGFTVNKFGASGSTALEYFVTEP